MFLPALLMTSLAGLSTGIGGLVVLFCKRPTGRMLAFSLGFAGGVMLTVSLVDMLPAATASYETFMSRPAATAAALSLFGAGCLIARLLSASLPEPEIGSLAAGADPALARKAAKSALVTAAVLLMHNLPEGILTLFTGYGNPKLGLTLTLAVALHNIPEGIAVSVPVYYATGSKKKAALWAFLSGLAEPAGALLCFFLLRRFITGYFLDGLVALIAGIMTQVSYSELIPGALGYGADRDGVWGMAAGTAVMWLGVRLLG